MNKYDIFKAAVACIGTEDATCNECPLCSFKLGCKTFLISQIYSNIDHKDERKTTNAEISIDPDKYSHIVDYGMSIGKSADELVNDILEEYFSKPENL